VVAFVQLRTSSLRPRPALAVNGLRNVGREGSRATSKTALFFSGSVRVSFYASRSYHYLACGRYTLLDVRGVIVSGGTVPRGKRHVNPRGDTFRVRVTRDPLQRRKPVTFSVRVEIPRLRFDQTYRRLRGAIDIRR